MKTCCNPEHKPPQPAAYALISDPFQITPRFICEACAWMLDNYRQEDLQELAEWEEEQLSDEEKRRRDWDEYHDREYHRLKDEGLL
jgi:hypothetical protein